MSIIIFIYVNRENLYLQNILELFFHFLYVIIYIIIYIYNFYIEHSQLINLRIFVLNTENIAFIKLLRIVKENLYNYKLYLFSYK